MKSYPPIYIIAGKNVLAGRGGYAVSGFNWGLIFSRLKFTVKIFCIGERDEVVITKAGQIHISNSIISSIFQDVEMAGLPILAPRLAFSILKNLPNHQPVILWGVGPWTLAGAFIKLFLRGNIILLSEYFTSLKHEYQGTASAVTVKDHGLVSKVKVVLTYLTIIPIYSLMEKFLLSQADKIITHYASTEKILKDQFGIKREKLVRLPYHVEVIKRKSVFEHKVVTGAGPLILLVCRHDGRKGINFLLHAFHLLNKKGVKYSAWILGAGPLLKKHKDLAKKLGLDNVNIPGFVADTKPFFKKASLFVFPSIEEGSSALAILEAMREGLPIVSTNVDGIPEDIEHGKSAILVPPKDPQALADAMQKLLKNPPLAKKLGQSAKKSYFQKYNLAKVKIKIKSFLASLRS